MFGIIGIVVTFAMVFGGYVMAGGKMGVILHSLPFEMMMIGGAAIGSYLLTNDSHTLKHTPKGIIQAFKGSKWTEADHQDVLCLMFQLLKIARENPVALEQHIENPKDSSVFAAYPRLLADHDVVSLIADTLRSASLNYDDPYQVEDMLSRRDIAAEGEHRAVLEAYRMFANDRGWVRKLEEAGFVAVTKSFKGRKPLTEASLTEEGRTAFVTIKFVSDQVNITRDKAGEVIDGDPEQPLEVVDIWTFARNTRSRNPNWTLIETRVPN